MMRFQSDRVREIREALGLTRAEFARRLGVSRQMVAFYEEGRYVPGTEVLMTLVSMTGAKIDSFFVDESDGQSVSKKATA
jgi:putative transcriptional regulator